MRRISSIGLAPQVFRACSSVGASIGAGDDQIVTPWKVEAKGPKGIAYDRIISQFKSEVVDQQLRDRFQSVVASSRAAQGKDDLPMHPLLKRGLAFSHRGLGDILDEVEKKRSFYLYTGRGPSASSMHIGHTVPFLLTKYLQDAFGMPLVIQITDDEKFLFRDTSLESSNKLAISNIKDIMAFGLDPSRTFIFRNTEYIGRMYRSVLEIQRLMTANMVKNTFGLEDSDNVGKFSFASIQAAPSFVSSFPNVLPIKSTNMKCLIPCAIDQDPFFILTRSICDRLKRPKPSLIHTMFLPALKGPGFKMSSSAEHNGVVLLSDSDEAVRKKMRSAFSGGRGTLEDLKAHGPDMESDVAMQYIRFFEPSDAKVSEIEEAYMSGAIHSGQVKDKAADALIENVLAPWRARRALITDDAVRAIMTERDILRMPKKE